MSHHIYHDFPIDASPQQVFAAISQPEHLVNWWPLKCTGKAKLGATYNFFFSPTYDWYAEVSTFQENTSLHFKMTKADRDWEPTSFGFDLEVLEKGGLNVQFCHVDWPDRNHHFRRSSFCWAILLQGLKDYVEKGKVIPFSRRS